MRGLGFDSHSIPGNALLLTVGRRAADRGRDPAQRRRVVRRRERPLREVADLPRPRDRTSKQRPLARHRPRAATPAVSDVTRRGRWATGRDPDVLRSRPRAARRRARGLPRARVQRRRSRARWVGRRRCSTRAATTRSRSASACATVCTRSLSPPVDCDRKGARDGGTSRRVRLALAYRLTLRILFRLLFQAYAEDTRLLPLHRNERYTRASLKELARDLAAHPDAPNDPRSTSLWDGLAQVWRVIDHGDEAWGVPAYDGGLFGSDADLHPDGAAIARLELHNDAVGPALAGLLVDVGVDGDRGPVDFRSLDVRDFGTIYEGLLESGLSLAPEDLTVDASGAWRPADGRRARRSGCGRALLPHEVRRSEGHGLLLHEALRRRASPRPRTRSGARCAPREGRRDRRARRSSGAARLFFDFRVADLAMGSGHFLVAAIGHIEAKFGAFLERNPIPGVERELLELRDAAHRRPSGELEWKSPRSTDRRSSVGRSPDAASTASTSTTSRSSSLDSRSGCGRSSRPTDVEPRPPARLRELADRDRDDRGGDRSTRPGCSTGSPHVLGCRDRSGA